MNKIYVHIGLPKTGTASLQELFFAAHPQLAYLGQTNLWTNPDAKTIIKSILVEDYGQSVGGKNAVSQVINRLLKDRGRLIISDEAFTFGEFMLRGPNWNLHSNHHKVATRIQNILGNVDIFIVFRNQMDWLTSWHRQGLKTGKYLERNFKKWLNKDLGQNRTRLYSLLDYESLYKTYCEVFGEDRIHVYFYENHKDRFGLLASQMAQVMGIDTTLARQSLEGAAKNVTGKHYYAPYPFIKKVFRAKISRTILAKMPASIKDEIRLLFSTDQEYIEMDKSDREKILQCFENSNRKLLKNLNSKTVPTGYC